VSSFETPPLSDGPSLPGGVPQVMPSAPTADERTLAMLAELLQLFSWMIGPLIIYFAKRDSPFVRFHAMQAVLWQALSMILSMACFAFMFSLVALAPKSGPPGTASGAMPVIFMLGFFGIFGLLGLANFVIAIYYAVKASSGVWAAYPVLGRLARKIAGV
jgi:uncharacterized Tic20 family protein